MTKDKNVQLGQLMWQTQWILHDRHAQFHQKWVDPKKHPNWRILKVYYLVNLVNLNYHRTSNIKAISRHMRTVFLDPHTFSRQRVMTGVESLVRKFASNIHEKKHHASQSETTELPSGTWKIASREIPYKWRCLMVKSCINGWISIAMVWLQDGNLVGAFSHGSKHWHHWHPVNINMAG